MIYTLSIKEIITNQSEIIGIPDEIKGVKIHVTAKNISEAKNKADLIILDFITPRKIKDKHKDTEENLNTTYLVHDIIE